MNSKLWLLLLLTLFAVLARADSYVVNCSANCGACDNDRWAAKDDRYQVTGQDFRAIGNPLQVSGGYWYNIYWMTTEGYGPFLLTHVFADGGARSWSIDCGLTNPPVYYYAMGSWTNRSTRTASPQFVFYDDQGHVWAPSNWTATALSPGNVYQFAFTNMGSGFNPTGWMVYDDRDNGDGLSSPPGYGGVSTGYPAPSGTGLYSTNSPGSVMGSGVVGIVPSGSTNLLNQRDIYYVGDVLVHGMAGVEGAVSSGLSNVVGAVRAGSTNGGGLGTNVVVTNPQLNVSDTNLVALASAELYAVTNRSGLPGTNTMRGQGESAAAEGAGQLTGLTNSMYGGDVSVGGTSGLAWTVHAGSWDIDLDPFSFGWVSDIASVTTHVIRWGCYAWLLLMCAGVVQQGIERSASARQATAASATPVASSVSALSMAAIMTAVLGTLPAFAVSALAAWFPELWTAFIPDVSNSSIQWSIYAVEQFVPVSSLVACTINYMVFRASWGGVYWLVATVLRFLVG